MFASDLDAASRQQLSRGQRLMELLKQPQYSPYPVEEQVVSVWLGTTGQLDDVAVEDVRLFEQDFLDHLRSSAKVLHHDPGDRRVRRRHRGGAARRELDAFKRGFAKDSRHDRAPRRATRSRADGGRGRRPGADRPAEARLRESLTYHGSPAAGLPQPDQVDPVAEEDLQRDGADRHLADRPSARRRWRRPRRTRTRSPARSRRWRPTPTSTTRCSPARTRSSGRRCCSHQRPRHGRRLLLQRAQGGRAARRAAARARRRAGAVRRRSQGRGVLPVPPAQGRARVDRLLRGAAVRERQGDRATSWSTPSSRARRTAASTRSTSSTPASSTW